MILRAVTLAAGLAGAFGAAQFPAFSQQYIQRLGGAVDALGGVIADFDSSAAAQGLNRAQALAQMTGTAFVERRRHDMQRIFDRHATLRADLAVLNGQGPVMRAYHAAHLTDAAVARRAWQAFQPALPLTRVTLIFAAAGFVLVVVVCMLLGAVVRGLLRHRAMAA